MNIIIVVVLIITSFILGRLTSPARFFKDDPVWLRSRLNELVGPEAESPVVQKPDNNVVDTVRKTIEDTKANIVSIFESQLLFRLSSGSYNYSHSAKEYKYIPKDSLIILLKEIVEKYRKTGVVLNIDIFEQRGELFLKVSVELKK